MAEDERVRRGRGRPCKIQRRATGKGAPLTQRVANYQSTSRAILLAAKKLVLQRGARALTLKAVAEAAHVDVTTVSYHFRTRHGLMEALLDLQYREPVADFVEQALAMPDRAQRVDAYLAGVREFCSDTDATRAYFEILIYSLHDPALRQRLSRLNSWAVQEFSTIIDPDSTNDAEVGSTRIFKSLSMPPWTASNSITRSTGTNSHLRESLEFFGRPSSNEVQAYPSDPRSTQGSSEEANLNR